VVHKAETVHKTCVELNSVIVLEENFVFPRYCKLEIFIKDLSVL